MRVPSVEKSAAVLQPPQKKHSATAALKVPVALNSYPTPHHSSTSNPNPISIDIDESEDDELLPGSLKGQQPCPPLTMPRPSANATASKLASAVTADMHADRPTAPKDLLAFFKPLTRDERQIENVRAAENANRNTARAEKKRQELKRMKEEEAERKKEHIKGQTAEQVRRYRESKKAQDLADHGYNHHQSSSLPIVPIPESSTDPNSGQLAAVKISVPATQTLRQGVLPKLAELSRPKGVEWKSHRNGMKGGQIQGQHERVNWCNPFLWAGIAKASSKVGWSARDIANYLHQQMPELYGGLHAGTIHKWLAPSKHGWSDATMMHVERYGHLPGSGRVGILKPFPEIVEAVKDRLVNMRKAGLPVSRKVARSVIIGIIQIQKPELLQRFKVTEVLSFELLAILYAH